MLRADKLLSQTVPGVSRTLAASLIEGGFVTANGKKVQKCAELLPDGAEFFIAENPLTRYVSRGGLKLEAALDAFSLDVKNKICADLGASTGGFTDCLLRRGAAKVYAVDSGSNQLHPSLRSDPRVVSMENRNARDLTGEEFEKVDLAVMDVSFISQSLLYDAVCRVLKPDGIFLSLIKPQFEAGKSEIGKNGVVKSEKTRLSVIAALKEKAAARGLMMKKTIPSPILGGDGNREFLALFERRQ